MKHIRTLSIISLLLFGTTYAAAEDLPCGNIISENIGEEEVEPIVDCADPFQVTTDPTATASFTASGEPLLQGDTITVATTTISIPIVASTDPESDFLTAILLLHDGDDYRQVAGEEGSNTVTITATGTYTLFVEATVPNEFGPTPPIQSRLQQVRDWFIPTAHAQIIIVPFDFERFAVTFTVEQVIPEPEPDPIGASSVLFLPGIQASRLYQERVIGTEDRVWEPSATLDNDVNNLRFNDAGESVRDIYTKPGAAIGRTQYIADNLIVYETWLERLAAEQASGTIASYDVFAYDWRYDVQDIVANGTIVNENGERRYPIGDLILQAKASPKEKVTIVAHSNGGLLAKAMLQEMERVCADNPNGPCALDFVDRMIMIGAPQLGTPEAVRTLLHGPTANWVKAKILEPASSRQVTRTLPGAHGLLTNSQYFAGLSGPLVTFATGTDYFADLATAFPDGISNTSQLQSFLTGKAGRSQPAKSAMQRPAVLTDDLVSLGLATNETLSNWQFPAGIEVVEVVGVGLHTTAALEYLTTTETVCLTGGFCFPVEVPLVDPQQALYGDGTVMLSSAAGYTGKKTTHYLNLQSYNEEAVKNENDDILLTGHENLTEPADVQDLVVAIVSSSTLPVSDYISTALPDYAGESTDGLSTHSPVMLVAEDTQGNQTGTIVNEDGGLEVVEDIPGSSFFMIGSSSYLYIPSETEYQVFIDGYATGTFSLLLRDIIEGEAQTRRVGVEAATTTASTTATFSKDGEVFSDLIMDINGDGEVDETVVLDEVSRTKAVVYAELRSLIASSSLSDRRKLLITTAVNQTEELGQLSTEYRFIAKLERKLLQQHIQKLKRWRDKSRLNKAEFKMLRATIKEIITLTRS